MKNYLALIRKADFTDLFKYGQLHVNNDMKTDFNCSVEELPSHPEIFFNLTHYANSFDSAFAYLIIHYVKTTSEGLSNDVYIEDVQNVYPLDFESKEAFAMSFDERIRIENPIWPESVWNLQKQQQFNDCEKGAANIRKIIGFTDPNSECKKFITNEILQEVVNELYDEKRPKGALSIWVYLLRYERHSYYPQNTLGYFMDMVNIVCNCWGQSEVEEDNIKNTQVFSFLNSLRKYTDLQFVQIYQQLIESPEAQGFLRKIDEFESRVDFVKVAVLFLILRNRYKEDFVYEENFISYSKQFGFEFELAAYLLGIVMGHTHTYDCMYDKLPLSIFKKAVKTSTTNANGWDNLLNNDNENPELNNQGTEDTIEHKKEEPETAEVHPLNNSDLGASEAGADHESNVAADHDKEVNTEHVGDSLGKIESEDSNNQESTSENESITSEENNDVNGTINAEQVQSANDPTQQEIDSKDEGINETSNDVTSTCPTTGNKDIFGEDEIKFPFKMRKPTGGKPRTIKNRQDYAKKYHKNLIDGYTDIIND